MAKIRKGDLVEVIAGNDKGKRGRVLRMIPGKNRLVIEGVNLRWKHMRKSQQNPQGGRVRREVPIQQSNVMLFDESAEVRTRVGYDVVGGKKVRIARKTGKPVGVAEPEKAKTAKKKTKKKASKAKAKGEES